jgi:hypothetical protein
VKQFPYLEENQETPVIMLLKCIIDDSMMSYPLDSSRPAVYLEHDRQPHIAFKDLAYQADIYY